MAVKSGEIPLTIHHLKATFYSLMLQQLQHRALELISHIFQPTTPTLFMLATPLYSKKAHCEIKKFLFNINNDNCSVKSQTFAESSFIQVAALEKDT